MYNFDDIQVDLKQRELRRAGHLVPVEPQVFDLLCLLIENRDRVMSREDISSTIWAGKVVSDGAISSRIKSLRRVLGDDGKAQRYIRTAHGVGFRFVGKLGGGTQPSAGEFAHPAAKPVVAVLPFTNQSGDPTQDYFSDLPRRITSRRRVYWPGVGNWIRASEKPTPGGLMHWYWAWCTGIRPQRQRPWTRHWRRPARPWRSMTAMRFSMP